MKSNFSVYQEMCKNQKSDGSWAWVGRIYGRGKSCGLVKDTNGVAASAEECREAFTKWWKAEREEYRIVEERIVPDEVAEDGRVLTYMKVFFTQDELDAEKAAEAAEG